MNEILTHAPYSPPPLSFLFSGGAEQIANAGEFDRVGKRQHGTAAGHGQTHGISARRFAPGSSSGSSRADRRLRSFGNFSID